MLEQRTFHGLNYSINQNETIKNAIKKIQKNWVISNQFKNIEKRYDIYIVFNKQNIDFGLKFRDIKFKNSQLEIKKIELKQMLYQKDNYEAWSKIYNQKIQKIKVAINEDLFIDQIGLDLISNTFKMHLNQIQLNTIDQSVQNYCTKAISSQKFDLILVKKQRQQFDKKEETFIKIQLINDVTKQPPVLGISSNIEGNSIQILVDSQLWLDQQINKYSSFTFKGFMGYPQYLIQSLL